MRKAILALVFLAGCQREKSHADLGSGGSSFSSNGGGSSLGEGGTHAGSSNGEGGAAQFRGGPFSGTRVGGAGGIFGRGGSGAASSVAGHGGSRRASSSSSSGGSVQGGTSSSVGATTDVFGVRKLYPTVPGGREWFLPDTANVADDEWIPDEFGSVSKTSESSVFHSDGNGAEAEVRLSVHSPSGKAWWQNVEMTMYSRKTYSIGGCAEHWELAARCEHHGSGQLPFLALNDGNEAPAGTKTWPWYSSMTSSSTYKENCVGSSYHGNVYFDTGRVLFEKEISHIDGYSGPRGSKYLSNWQAAINRWFGYKFVLRNYASDSTRVHMELWLDLSANGTWEKSSEFDDGPGTWLAETSTLDGCDQPPYSYTRDQVIAWAGPWVLFRSDCIGMDFKWLSAREISPLP